MTKVSIRLPEGIYFTVSEMAEKLGLEKADTIAILVAAGLSSVDPEFFSKQAKELMTADYMESLGSFLRWIAHLPPEQRKMADELWKEFLGRIKAPFGETFLGAGEELQ